MGESFLGLPNRTRIIGRDSDGNLTDKLASEMTYNPQHVLSAYYGYRLSAEYINRSGGSNYAMTGSFYSKALIPTANESYDIGLTTRKYKNIYAASFHGALDGNAGSASKLQTSRQIKVTLSNSTNASNNYGAAYFDGSSNINITVAAPYLPITGGTVSGSVTVKGNVAAYSIVPDTANIRTVGTASNYYSNMYASVFHGALDGNARSASKLQTARTIYVKLTDAAGNAYASGSAAFDGSSDPTVAVNIVKNLPYLSITGGDITGAISCKGIYGGGAGQYVHLHHNGTVPGLSISGGRYIDAYIDDLACDIICSSGVTGKSGSNDNLDIYANQVTLHWFGSMDGNYMDPSGNVACWAKSDLLGDLKCDYVYCNVLDNAESGSPIYGWSAIEMSGKTISWVTDTGDTNVKIGPGSEKNKGYVQVNGKTVLGSDIRIKQNINSIQRNTSVGILSELTPTSYDLSENNRHRGLIAQQVKEVLLKYDCADQICGYSELDEDHPNSLTLDYIGLIPDLINAFQYLLAKVDSLEVKAGIKESLQYPDLQKEATFDEKYYREHAEEIAKI